MRTLLIIPAFNEASTLVRRVRIFVLGIVRRRARTVAPLERQLEEHQDGAEVGR